MTTSITMKRHFIAQTFTITTLILLSLSACKKPADIKHDNFSKPSFSYSSEVLDKWMTMELRLMKNATGIPNQAFTRHFVYAGIAALESIGPTIPAHEYWMSRWNGLSGLPKPDHSVQYYYPANVNAAMASISKAMFSNASNIDKAAIDSLENALKQDFLSSQSPSLIEASAEFGKGVANAVFNWADNDCYKNAGR